MRRAGRTARHAGRVCSPGLFVGRGDADADCFLGLGVGGGLPEGLEGVVGLADFFENRLGEVGIFRRAAVSGGHRPAGNRQGESFDTGDAGAHSAFVV